MDVTYFGTSNRRGASHTAEQQRKPARAENKKGIEDVEDAEVSVEKRLSFTIKSTVRKLIPTI
jgi:hypothetical protein